jgi:hypothetical protein
MNFDRFDQFEAYTDNLLPADKRESLEQQLAVDATLRAELDEYQQLERLHVRLDQKGALENRPQPVTVPRPRRLRLAWAGAMLVVLMTGFGLYWLTRSTPAEQTFVAFYQPEPVARGLADCGPELTPGLRAYRAGAYSQALEDFGKLPANQPCVLYYRGVSRLALGDAGHAVTELEQAVASQTGTLGLTRRKAEWYLTLAYLKASRTDDARRQLSTIISQRGHPFQNIARKALDKLGHA